MGSIYSFMDIIILASGVYVLYIFYLLKFKGEIKETLLLPKGMSPNKCKDKQAYISEMAPKVLVYGIVVVICGIFGMLESNYQLLGTGYLVVLVAFLAMTIWFAIQSKKAVTKYW